MANIDHKQIILKKSLRAHLLDVVDTKKVVTHMEQYKALTVKDVEELSKVQTRKGRTDKLLWIIAQKEPEVYEEFLKALEKDRCFVAFYLLKEGRLAHTFITKNFHRTQYN